MDRRAAARLTLVLAWAAAACEPTAAPRPGSPLPDLGAHAGSAGIEVLWMLRDRDVYACRSAAVALRRARQGSQPVQLTIVAVGRNEQLVEPFVRAQRLRARVVRLTLREFIARAGPVHLPALMVARDGRITHLWESAPEVIAATEGEPAALHRAIEGRRGERRTFQLPGETTSWPNASFSAWQVPPR